MGKYEVGQILYLTNEKSFKIIPIQVVEEVTRTTIDGTFKTYHIQFPDKKGTIVDIADIKFNCFKTELEVKEYLMNNTRIAIDKLLATANELKSHSFSYSSKKQSPLLASESDKNNVQSSKNSDIINLVEQHPAGSDSDIIKIDLGNGQIGKVNKEDLSKIGEK
jgi:hypothetical protein